MSGVHNAAISPIVPTPELTSELFSDVFDTNVRGPALLTKAALPFIPPGGRIILLSSIAGRQASPVAPVPLYAAFKSAVESLARTWAFEVRDQLITSLIPCSVDGVLILTDPY
jgi:3-oxoacyl-[acyl-carrier protein] reductase